MKKIIFILFVLFLTGCGFIPAPPCEHDYKESVVEATCQKEGTITKTCSKCLDTQLVTIPMKEHDYEENVVEPTCIDDGYTLNTCKKCGVETKKDIKNKLGHDYSDWEILINPTEFNDGFQKRICLRCNQVDEQIIASVNYIDLDAFRINYQKGKQYTVNTYEELLALYNVVILSQDETLTCELNFEPGDITALIEKLMDDSKVSVVYTVTPVLNNNILKLSIDYDKVESKKTPGVNYVQYDSGNISEFKSTRTNDFDGFAINNAMYQFKVYNSEQLFYVLERNVQPICEPGSSAEIIFNEIKKVLIEIIDDNMTEVEKVKAIHDWLVMNVTYDAQLLNIVMNGSDAAGYRSFDLEGVFLDQKAVCEGIAKAFVCMTNIEGIPSIYVDGYQTNNPNGLGHAWNKVYIEGNWYIIDATSAGVVINEEFEILSYKKFLISEENMSVSYIPRDNQNVICTKNYDVYKKSNFNYENTNYDFEIGSIEELVTIIKYFDLLDYEHKSIEFKIVFNFGDSIVDELQEALSLSNINDKITYVQENNIIALVK